MNQRENIFRAIRFEGPDFIPMNFHINAACWQHYDQERLCELIEDHPFLFPDFQRPKLPYTPDFALVARRDELYKDDFSCVWQTSADGITGTVTGHPLSDWQDYPAFNWPDPDHCTGIGPIDWAKTAQSVARAKAAGAFSSGGLRHGHTFLQLQDLRGYENLIYDMADENPLLWDLIDRLESFNLAFIKNYADLGVDMLTYPEDLGMQKGPMLAPADFRKYIKPSYQRLMQVALEHDILVHFHSDGHLHDLIDDLVTDAVDVINLQDLVNGIDWIEKRLAGKVCIELDIDRQFITPFGSPEQIDALIKAEVARLGSRQGGLMMVFGLYPGTPLANVKAVMSAMERYAFYWS